MTHKEGGERDEVTRRPLDFRDHLGRALHGHARQPRRHDGAAGDPRGPRRGDQRLEWTVNAYTLTFAVLLLTGAALGDRFGRRRMFAIGLGIFTAASALAALAPSIEALDAARALQGVGGAIVTPLTLTILSAAVPAERRGLALGAWGGIGGLAVAFGPLVGGAVVYGISWHWIFWLNVPIGLVLVAARAAAARRELRPRVEARPAGPRPRRAPACSGSSGASSAATRSAGARPRSSARSRPAPCSSPRSSPGSSAPSSRCCRCASSATGRSRSRTSRRLFMFFGMFGSIFLLAQFFQTVQGYSPLASGLRILPWTAMPMIVAPIAGALSDRIGGHRLMGLGLALQAIGLGVDRGGLDADDAVRRPRRCRSRSPGSAWRSSSPRSRTSSSRAVRFEEQGQASGANNAIRELGGVFGVAVLASVFAHYGGYETRHVVHRRDDPAPSGSARSSSRSARSPRSRSSGTRGRVEQVERRARARAGRVAQTRRRRVAAAATAAATPASTRNDTARLVAWAMPPTSGGPTSRPR